MQSEINPLHYLNELGEDLFEEWYQRLPFEVFRDVMRCVAERYIRRYHAKNGLIDLQKGIEVLNRLEKYEIRHLKELEKVNKIGQEMVGKGT